MVILDIKNLEYFLAVARFHNFSKAAQALHVSQPSISRAVKELEINFDVLLFQRDTHSVKLTDAGYIVAEQAQQIVSAFYNISTQINSIGQIKNGEIYIALPPITAITSVAPLLHKFKMKYPGINVHLAELGPKDIEQYIINEEYDFGIFTPDCNNSYEKIWFEHDSFDVVMHNSNLLTKEKIIDFKMLKHETFAMYTQKYKIYFWILSECQKAGFEPHIALETSQKDWMLQVAASNQGIAILPHKICQEIHLPDVISRPLNPEQLFLNLALVWKKDHYLSPAAREFISFSQKEKGPNGIRISD